MWDGIRRWVIQKFVLDWVLKSLDKWLKKLPEDEKKTVTGFGLALLGILVRELPAAGGYLQPIVEMLSEMPHEKMVVGGVLWSTLGMFHKAIKWLISKFDKSKEAEAE
jgi:hypothetical protein